MPTLIATDAADDAARPAGSGPESDKRSVTRLGSGPEFDQAQLNRFTALTPNFVLSPTALSTHLACPHYTQLERKRRAGELEVDFMPDPRLEAMRVRGAEHGWTPARLVRKQ